MPRLPQSRTASAGRGAGGRRRRVGRADRRGAAARRPPRLSLGRPATRRLPRRYRGRDLIWWLGEMGYSTGRRRSADRRRSVRSISGAYGGHTIDFRRFAADGITLLGRMRGGARRRARYRARSCRKSGERRSRLTRPSSTSMDAHVAAARPRSARRPRRPGELPDPPCVTEPLQRLDLGAGGIDAVIWATGYGVDFGWIDIPVLDAQRRAAAPRRHHRRARAVFPRPAMAVEMNSSFLSGVGDDAAVLADHIAARG